MLLTSIMIILSGCTSTHFGSLPETGPTMQEIYQKKTQTVVPFEVQRNVKHLKQVSNQEQLQNGAEHYPKSNVTKLNNPVISMVVFPQLVGSTAIPEFETVFTLFEQDQFVLSKDLA